MRPQHVPGIEAVLPRDGSLRVAQSRRRVEGRYIGRRTAAPRRQKFFSQVFELIEVGPFRQTPDGHGRPPFDARLASANRPKEGAETAGAAVTGGLSPWRTNAPWCAVTRLAAVANCVKTPKLGLASSTLSYGANGHVIAPHLSCDRARASCDRTIASCDRRTHRVIAHVSRAIAHTRRTIERASR